MKKLSSILLMIIGVVTLTGCQGYNRLVEKQEAVTAQWWQRTKCLSEEGGSHPQPGQHRKGIRHSRAGNIYTGYRGQGKSHTDHHQPGEPHCRKSAGISAGTKSAEPGSGQAVIDPGKLSRAEGESKLSRAAG